MALEGDIEVLMREVEKDRTFGSPDAPVPLRLADIDHALQVYETGVMTAEQLEAWADFLEMREDVDYENGSEAAIAELLFRISTPEINEPITLDLARRMRASLKSA